MLDEVLGSEEIVTIRQDCIGSFILNTGHYYIGNKAEGPDLPGSDHDYMHDINNGYNIRAV